LKNRYLIIILIFFSFSLAIAERLPVINIVDPHTNTIKYEDFEYLLKIWEKKKDQFNNSIEYKALLGALYSQFLMDKKAVELLKTIPFEKQTLYSKIFYASSLRRLKKYKEIEKMPVNYNDVEETTNLNNTKALALSEQKRYEEALNLIKNSADIKYEKCSAYFYILNSSGKTTDNYIEKCVKEIEKYPETGQPLLINYYLLNNRQIKAGKVFTEKYKKTPEGSWLYLAYKSILKSKNTSRLITSKPISYLLVTSRLERYPNSILSFFDDIVNQGMDEDTAYLLMGIIGSRFTDNRHIQTLSHGRSYILKALYAISLSADKKSKKGRVIYEELLRYKPKGKYENKLRLRLIKAYGTFEDLLIHGYDFQKYSNDELEILYQYAVLNRTVLKTKDYNNMHKELLKRVDTKFDPVLARLYAAQCFIKGLNCKNLIPLMQKAVKYNSGQEYSYRLLIMLLAKAGKYDEALNLIHYCEKEITPSPVFRYLYKRVMERSGRAWWVDK